MDKLEQALKLFELITGLPEREVWLATGYVMALQTDAIKVGETQGTIKAS